MPVWWGEGALTSPASSSSSSDSLSSLLFFFAGAAGAGAVCDAPASHTSRQDSNMKGSEVTNDAVR